MRIGIDMRRIGAPGPGQQRYLWRLAHRLAERGHLVAAMTTHDRKPATPEHERVRLISLVDVRGRALRKRVRALELDVFFANPERARHYVGVPMHVMRPGYGTQQGRQNLRSLHSDLERRAYEWFRRMPWIQTRLRAEAHWYAQTAPRPLVVANSAYTKRDVQHDYGVPAESIYLVRNGVDVREFTPERRLADRGRAREAWGFPEAETVLLFVGHNFRRKGLWETFDAVAALRQRGASFRLLVAGRGTGRLQVREAQRRIERLELESTVTLAGKVGDVAFAYSAADALVFPSWHDSFGFVVLEAAAMGLPALTTRFAGASEIIEDGVDGVVIERPDDTLGLQTGLAALLYEGKREAMGRAARTMAERHTEADSLAALVAVIERAGGRRA